MIKVNVYKLFAVGVFTCLNLLNLIAYQYSLINLVVLIDFVTLFFFYLFVLRIQGYVALFEITNVFAFFFFLYTMSYPFLAHTLKVLNYQILDVSYESVLTGSFLSSTALSIYLIINTLLLKKSNAEKYINSFSENLKKINLNNGFYVVDIFSCLMALYYVCNFINSGGLGLIGKDRFTISETIREGNFWLLKYYMVVYTGYVLVSLYNKVKFDYLSIIKVLKRDVHRLLIISIFWVFNIFAGSRRELIYVFLFMLVIYLLENKIKKLSRKMKISLLITFLLTLLYGYIRNMSGNVTSINSQLLIINSLGDFLFPVQTLYYYIDHTSSLMYGASYFNIFLLLIPRKIWPEKPSGLAVNFVNEINSSIGYAFTPMTEAYLNFHYLSALIFPIIMVILVFFVKRIGKRKPVLYVLAFVEVVNINRAEISMFLLEVLIMYVSFEIIGFFARKKFIL